MNDKWQWCRLAIRIVAFTPLEQDIFGRYLYRNKEHFEKSISKK